MFGFVTTIDRSRLQGTSISEAHNPEFLDNLDEALVAVDDQVGLNQELNVRLQGAEQETSLRAILAGSIRQELDASPIQVAAADLNAAAVDTFFTRFRVFLRSIPPTAGVGILLDKIDLVPVLTVAATLGAGLADPTVVGTFNYSSGILDVLIKWDTSGGGTYVNGNFATIDVQLSAGNTYLGFTVPLIQQRFDVI